MSIPHEPEPVPSISELRSWFTRSRPRIGTGWPALDVVTDLLHRDPLTAVREQTRTYYLSDLPVDGYAEGFLGAARRVIDRRDGVGARAHDDLAVGDRG